MTAFTIKKTVLIIAAVICLVLPVSANSESTRNVVDNANVLSETDIFLLQSTIDGMINKYNADFVIVTENGIDKTPEAYADDYYDYNGYGYDEQLTGVLLLIDFAERDMQISTTGDAINLLSDSSLAGIINDIRPYLQSEDYYFACNTFLNNCDLYFTGHNADGPSYVYVESEYDPDIYAGYDGDYFVSEGDVKLFFIGLIIGLIISTIVVLLVNRSYKKAKSQVTSQYLDAGSVDISLREDKFVSTHTSVTVLPKDNKSGGGSSTHSSSSGSTHGGAGGKF